MIISIGYRFSQNVLATQQQFFHGLVVGHDPVVGDLCVNTLCVSVCIVCLSEDLTV